jgi:hypothetical protein
MKKQAFKKKKSGNIMYQKFKILKNHLKMEGGATGSTIFKNGVKNLTPQKNRELCRVLVKLVTMFIRVLQKFVVIEKN